MELSKDNFRALGQIIIAEVEYLIKMNPGKKARYGYCMELVRIWNLGWNWEGLGTKNGTKEENATGNQGR